MKKLIVVLFLVLFYVPKINFMQKVITDSMRAEVEKRISSINKINSEKGYNWKAGITSKSFLSLEELSLLCGLTIDKSEALRLEEKGKEEYNKYLYINNGNLNKSLTIPNWIAMMSNVEDQETDGCNKGCWAYAATGLVEGLLNYFFGSNISFNLDEANITNNASCGTCQGSAWEACGLDYIINNKVKSEYQIHSFFPNIFENAFYSISSYSENTVSINDIKYALQYSPVLAGMNIYSDFEDYSGGIYVPSGTFAGTHAVVILGFDDVNNCWICRNSYGTDWGEIPPNGNQRGYFRISYGECGIDAMSNVTATITSNSCFAKIVPNFQTISNAMSTSFANGEEAYILNNSSISSGQILNISSGSKLIFKNNSLLNVYGILNINGTSNENVIFDFINPSSSNGIKVNAGGVANINYAEIKNAYNGVYLDNSASTIKNSKIHNCSYGIKTNYNTPTIETNKVYDNSYGIFSYQGSPKITDNYIYNIVGYGITINGSTNAFIRKNTLSYCHGGIYAYGNQSIKLRGYSGYSYGLNLIQNYYSDKVLYVTGGTADLGEYGYSTYLHGNNNIIKNYTPVIVNSTSNEILAEKNYWNGTPQSSWFVGSISYDPFLSSPNSSAGSSIDKDMGIEPDKLLLAEASELSDMKSLESSSEKFKQLITEYPESKYAGLAVAWDMSLNKSEGNLNSQKEYLHNNLKHKNKLVSNNSLLWLETLYSEAGDIKEAEKIVQLTSPEEIIGTEIRLNYANDLLNLYNDKQKAEEIFNEILKYNKSDDIDYAINVIKEMANYSENNLKNIQNLAKDIEINTEELPNEYELFSNFPNPFNPTTKIKYNIPYNSQIGIRIYDIMGKEIKSFNDISNTSGVYELEWNGTNNYGEQVSSGIYLLKFKANSVEGNNKSFSKTLKLMLLK